MLPCFSKVLEHIMYNLLFKYLVENNILYSKKCYFQNIHSTDNAIAQLVDQIIESLKKKTNINLVYSLTYGTVDYLLTLYTNPFLSKIRAIRYKWQNSCKDNSLKSMKKIKQAQRRAVRVFQKVQFQDYSYFSYM